MNKKNNIIINNINNDEIVVSIEKKFLDCTSTDSKNFDSYYMKKFFDDYCDFESELEYLRIETNKRTIFICGDIKRICCEKFSFSISIELESLCMFENSILKSIEVISEQLLSRNNYIEGGVVFIDIRTNYGVIPITIYNEHNGYYGHKVMIFQLNSNLLYSDQI